jgi:hypothetical protein
MCISARFIPQAAPKRWTTLLTAVSIGVIV